MRIPSLDGLRALSILLVLFGHANGTKGLGTHLQIIGDVANLGVRVFFVISGFLITSLLLKEEQVALGQFYWRRFYRIFPPYYFYLAVIWGASALGLVAAIPTRDFIYAATYTTNVVSERSWLIGHTWSLSVEEQFYLLWPGLLALVGSRRALLTAGAVVLLVPLVRVGTSVLLPSLRPLIGEAFPTICDSIATGCLLAGFRGRMHQVPSYLAALKNPWIVPLLVLGLIGINTQQSHPLPFWLVGETMLNVGVAFLVDRAVSHPDTTFGRLLNFKPLARLGMASYSVYLWQQVFLNRHSDAFVSAFPQNLVFALAAGFAGFYFVEKPIMKYRDKLIPQPKAKAH